MYCSNCGNLLVKGSKFCASCGTKVGLSQFKPTSVVSNEAVPNKEEKEHEESLANKPNDVKLRADLRQKKQLQSKLKWTMLGTALAVVLLYTFGVLLDRHSQSLYQRPSSEAKFFYTPGHVFLASFFIAFFYSFYNRRTFKKGLTQLKTSKNPTTQADEKKAKLIGLDGWLAWFMLGLVISAGYSVYDAYSYHQLLSAQGLNDYKGTVTFIVIGFGVLAVLQATSFFLILKKLIYGRRLIIFTLILGIVVYGTVSSLLSSIYSKAGKSVPMDVTNGISRDIFLSVVWVLYFIFSRRVKLTLTQKKSGS
jgi:hypothetical protein